jgi:hypothetical protein
LSEGRPATPHYLIVTSFPNTLLIASGAISDSGSFTSIYREELEDIWRKECEKLGIKHTKNITMSKVLGNDVTIR